MQNIENFSCDEKKNSTRSLALKEAQKKYREKNKEKLMGKCVIYTTNYRRRLEGEKKENFNKKCATYSKKFYHNLSDEKKEEYLRKRREYSKNYYAEKISKNNDIESS